MTSNIGMQPNPVEFTVTRGEAAWDDAELPETIFVMLVDGKPAINPAGDDGQTIVTPYIRLDAANATLMHAVQQALQDAGVLPKPE